MQIHTKEHHELMEHFERVYRGEGRFDREDKAMWPRGAVYQDGAVNKLFLAFRHGYSVATCIYIQDAA